MYNDLDFWRRGKSSHLLTQELVLRLVSWIKETVLTGGGEGVVFGLSGGIDSAVVAVLCKRAFPETTLGLIMPCYSDKADREYAEMVANKFDISTNIIVLDKVYDSLIKILPDSDDMVNKQEAEANIKPRLRMVTLYYFANSRNYLVVGTSNKSELSVGYFTKYGDGGADLIPLGDLVKQQVRKLASFLKVPEEIIEKPPSAGLWKGQTDEGQLGLTYKELDHYLTTCNADEVVKKRIDTMIHNSAHKRNVPLIFRS